MNDSKYNSLRGAKPHPAFGTPPLDKGRGRGWGQFLLLAGLLRGKSSDEFKCMIRDLFAPYDNEILLSVTYGNGREATDYHNIEQILQCDLYFANPGSPWQRGNKRKHQRPSASLFSEAIVALET